MEEGDILQGVSWRPHIVFYVIVLSRTTRARRNKRLESPSRR